MERRTPMMGEAQVRRNLCWIKFPLFLTIHFMIKILPINMERKTLALVAIARK